MHAMERCWKETGTAENRKGDGGGESCRDNRTWERDGSDNSMDEMGRGRRRLLS